jgi:RND family efflux transporter MFP subunit
MTRIAVALCSLSTLPLAGLARAAEPAPQQPPVQVRLVRTTQAGAGAAWIAASVAAEHRAALSTRLSAQVRSVLVEEGARVKQGQLLVTLGDEDVRAQLAAAETAFANARLYERRIADLAAQRAATPVELEAAQAQRAQAAAAVAAARASLSYTQIRAPFDGTVQARRVNRGDLVGPGQPLVDVEGAGLEIQATLAEDEAQGLRIGQRIRFRAGDRQGEALVTALTTGADPLSHRRMLRARIPGATPLRSGAFARIEVPGAAPSATRWVPRSAVVQRGDLTGVFVADGGHARLRWIAPGEASGDDVAVRAGLGRDEPVIDAPGALRDGQRVEVVRGD